MLIAESLNKNQGIIDPALYTLPEYLDIANPGGKSHGSEPYTSNTKQLTEYFKKSDYPELIQQKTVRGINFQVLAKQIDKLELLYAKKDKDGNYVYVNGELSMLSKEEKKLFITDKNRYDYEFVIYDTDNNTVAGKTQDEWGCLLVRVAEEYSGFGFGELLVSLHRKYVPNVDSGGFTPQGKNNLMKVHAYFVKDALSNGTYSSLLKDNKITMERIKSIVNSTKLVKTKIFNVFYSQNLPKVTVDPDNLLLLKEHTTFALYDKTIDPLSDNLWNDKKILAAVHWVEFSTYRGQCARIFSKHGEGKYLAFVFKAMLADIKTSGIDSIRADSAEEFKMLEKLGCTHEEIYSIESSRYDNKKITTAQKDIFYIPSIEPPTPLYRIERKFRKEKDKENYEEYSTALLEKIDSILNE